MRVTSAMAVAALLIAASVQAEPLKIIGFDTSSGIKFEGATVSNYYTMEFATSPGGPWTNWASLTEQSVTGSVMSAPSPMFYRIKQTDSSAFPPYAPATNIPGCMLSDGAVIGSKIAAGAISSSALAAGAVGTVNLDPSVSNAFVLKSGDTMTGTLIVNADIVGARMKIGAGHTLNGTRATISGGEGNVINADHATIGGGYHNQATGPGAVIAGGGTDGGGSLVGNIASGHAAAIGGGTSNRVSSWYGTVAGGYAGTASADHATVGGGALNTASGPGSVVGGGGWDGSTWGGNTAGGQAATVSGGFKNTAGGTYATVPGGDQNTAGGRNSLAAGHRAQANTDGAFVWADNQEGDFTSTAANQFLIRAAGGVGIGTTTPAEKLEVAGRILLNGDNANLDGANLSYLRNSGKMLVGGNISGWEGEADFIQNRGGGGAGGYAFYDLANSGATNNLMRLKGDGSVGLGIAGPVERLEVAGAVKVGNTTNPTPAAGTIRWTGTDFQGYDGYQWLSLTGGAAPGGMVLVPGGTFTMGSTLAMASPVPEHQVTLNSFYLSKYEVTYALWYAVRQWALANLYNFQNAGREGNGNVGLAPSSHGAEPVTAINWRDAIVWCNARSEKEGLTPVYTFGGQILRDSRDVNTAACDNATFNITANGYRLPTEAEWEYAARYQNGSNWTPGHFLSGATAYAYDSTASDLVAWYDYNAGGTRHKVGTKKPNHLGISDMSGNAWEWCWDWSAAYSSSAVTNPVGPASGVNRTSRGGDAINSESWAECSVRHAVPPDSTYSLRCARGF